MITIEELRDLGAAKPKTVRIMRTGPNYNYELLALTYKEAKELYKNLKVLCGEDEKP